MKVYENCKIYGPYLGKDGRKRIHVKFPNNTLKTVSYPKYLVEVYLNRYLESYETVDHIDRNIENNDISNLQVLIRSEHSSIDAKRVKSILLTCPQCNNEFLLCGSKIRNAISNRKKGKVGPFCSRSCAGKYSQSVQVNRNKILIDECEELNRIYFQYDKT